MRFARPCLLLVAAATLLLTLNGCGMSEEDRDFYLHGWVKPTDLDKPTAYDARRRQAVDGSASTLQSAPLPPPTSSVREPVPAIEFQ